MNISIRSSDLTELANKPELIPQAGTATLVSGTGTFIAPISMLREIARAPDAVQQLEDIVEALAEQEQLYAMAILGAAVTGIANTLWYIPVAEGQHGPTGSRSRSIRRTPSVLEELRRQSRSMRAGRRAGQLHPHWNVRSVHSSRSTRWRCSTTGT